ncbi:MAG: binding protein, partial [Clostridia bacterium]|nr:binding protein [Clostridia bacterium]
MEKYIEKSKELKIYGSFDVIVVGGGTAGAVAAIASAREGMNTLVIEQFGALGGLSTLGVVTPVMHSGIKGNPMCSGISDEINQYCLDNGYSFRDWNNNAGHNDPLFLRFAFESLAVKAGVKILYHTYFSDVIKEGNELKGIIVENKAGRQAIYGKRIIDATGDADVSVIAGVGYEKGNPKTG